VFNIRPMEDVISVAMLTVAALVLSIIALVKSAGFKASIDELKKRILELERRGVKPTEPAPAKSAVPPPLPAYVTQPRASTPKGAASMPAAVPAGPHPSFNWESILGVKLFAWVGGLALFLGVVFFIKYAFENNWITPLMRIVSGAIAGAALIGVSLFPRVRGYRVPSQSLCATGLLILYADIYATHSFYDLIPLTAATGLMWIVTAVALVLALGVSAQSVAWLGIIGGFVTPALFKTSYNDPIVLFGYIGVLSCAAAAVGAFKRWNYLFTVAAIGSVITEFAWAADFFGQSGPDETRFVFLAMQALFLAICIELRWTKLSDYWTITAAAIAGFAPLLAFIIGPLSNFNAGDFGFMTLLVSAAGLIAIAAAHRQLSDKSKGLAVIVEVALLFTWLGEWSWFVHTLYALGGSLPVVPSNLVLWIYVAIFLLFAVTPYFCGTKRVWPWIIAAISGPLQFWFVHWYMTQRMSHSWLWLPTLAFALPAAIGIWYLTKREHLELVSGDSRLAAQGAAVLVFVSLVFPVQFHREWITLGWAIEGLLLILLFRWISNRRLRAVALIVLAAAFVRLAINPAVLSYHPRTHVPIWNWYLYAYGIAAVCFFLSARWFGQPKEKRYERNSPVILYSLAGIVLFLLLNIEIADYFSIGPTLTFSFEGNFARDMTYTISWSLFAFGLLILGIVKTVRGPRLVAIGLICLAFAKLFLHDLDTLSQLYRIAAFIAVAVIAIVASFVYQRFLSPRAKA
jgi:uncharacterized membrane protein